MNDRLTILALSDNGATLVSNLTQIINNCKCSIRHSRMLRMDETFAAMATVTGNWSTLARLEVQLQRLAKDDQTDIMLHRTTTQENLQYEAIPYTVEAITLDQPGVLYHLTHFFLSHSATIEELSSRNYPAPHTGADMCTVNMTVGIPANTHIAGLRDDFADFCDQLNLDAILEPIKG